jgi:ATP adenylyltransferase
MLKSARLLAGCPTLAWRFLVWWGAVGVAVPLLLLYACAQAAHQLVHSCHIATVGNASMGGLSMHKRKRVTEQELKAYIHRCQTGPCFICQIVAGEPEERHRIVYKDDIAIVFLDRYPKLYGYTLVAPREHREQVTGDFTLDEYLALQRIIYQVAQAVQQETSAERVYLLSLGSQQGNSHMHWHIAPLPPGVPYQEQQLETLSVERGILELSDEERAELAQRIRRRMEENGI